MTLLSIGQQTGYLLDSSTTDDALTLASAVCSNVAQGYSTWDSEYYEAIADGADPGSAALWNNYLRDEVCPNV